MSADRKTAVITGGAGGLGRALSDKLQSQGWQVVLLDIDIGDLEETETQLPIRCDLTDAVQLDAAVSRIGDLTGRVDLVIYNAGITHIGAASDLSEAAHRKLFEVNYFSATALARALLPSVRRAQGAHLAMSSVAGFSPLYHRTAYAASKHAMEGFFGSLRSEERPFGVRVHIAAPSFVATNAGMTQSADGLARPGSASDGIDAMTPDQAADAILRGVERNRPMITVGRVARLSWLLHRLSPSLFQRIMERRIRGNG